MKKNVFLFLLTILNMEVAYSHDIVFTSSAASDEQQEQIRGNDFEDFFGVDEMQPVEGALQQPKKEKPSTFQIFFMQMGSSIINTMDNFYMWICSLWAYAQSLVNHETEEEEERKA